MSTRAAVLPERLSNGKLPKFTSVGCYPLIYVTKRGEVLCADCVDEHGAPDSDDPAIAADVHWEGAPDQCVGCNTMIMSAYGDPDCAHETRDADGNCTFCGGS